MNIHEAAEIVRRNKVAYRGQPGIGDGDYLAREFLLETMLSWLDPTPITEERLLENRWVQNRSRFSKGEITIRKQTNGGWKTPWYLREIFTLGELRAMLWLMGGGE